MPYDVIKRVGRRAYRYRVERYPDPETGRSRARWVYLGVVDDASTDAVMPLAAARRAAGSARTRLLDAFGRVAERLPYASITADAVAAEAGVAHGTFYRYFRDKRDLFASALERVREDLARIAPSFDPPYGSREVERERVRSWLTAIYAKPAGHPGLLRAFFEAVDTDPELGASRAERRRERVAKFSRYLEALADAGTITTVRDPAELAATLLVLVEAMFRAAIDASDPGAAAVPSVAGTIDVFDRAVFGSIAATVAEPNGAETAAWTAAIGASATETRAPES